MKRAMARALNGDVALGAGLGLIGGVLAWSSHRQSAAVFLLPGDAPPFLVPQLFLYLWIGLSLLILWRGFARGVERNAAQATRGGAVIAVFAVVAVAAALMPVLGYLSVAPPAVFFTVRLLGYRRFWVNAAAALAVPVLLYIALGRFAGLPLPRMPFVDLSFLGL